MNRLAFGWEPLNEFTGRNLAAAFMEHPAPRRVAVQASLTRRDAETLADGLGGVPALWQRVQRRAQGTFKGKVGFQHGKRKGLFFSVSRQEIRPRAPDS
jgi:hypothetical protein